MNRRTSILKRDATNRLSDFDIEEVSLVDRAANKRRFLVIKRAVTGNGDTANMKLTAKAKESMLASLTKAVQQSVTLVKQVKEAEETEVDVDVTSIDDDLVAIIADLQGASPTLEIVNKVSDIGTEAGDKLKAIAAIITSVAEATSPAELESMLSRLMEVSKAEGAASRALKNIGEVSMDLAAQAESGAPLSADSIAKINALAGSLNELIQKNSPKEEPMKVTKTEPVTETVTEAPAAPATETTPEAPVATEEVEVKPPAAPAAEAVVESAPAVTEPAAEQTIEKAAAVFASQVLADITKNGLSDERRAQLTAALGVLDIKKSAVPAAPVTTTEPAAKPAAAATPEPAAEVKVLTAEIEQVTKSLSDLQAKVKTLTSTTAAPASRGIETPEETVTTVRKEDTTKRRGGRWIFPQS